MVDERVPVSEKGCVLHSKVRPLTAAPTVPRVYYTYSKSDAVKLRGALFFFFFFASGLARLFLRLK